MSRPKAARPNTAPSRLPPRGRHQFVRQLLPALLREEGSRVIYESGRRPTGRFPDMLEPPSWREAWREHSVMPEPPSRREAGGSRTLSHADQRAAPAPAALSHIYGIGWSGGCPGG